MTNVSSVSLFSNLDFSSQSFDTKGKEGSQSNGEFLSEYSQFFDQENVSSMLLRRPEFNKSEAFYLLGVTLSLSKKHLLSTREQAEFYPSNKTMRQYHRSPLEERSSRADSIRSILLKKGLIELIRNENEKIGRVKLSHKFFLFFVLMKLREQRDKIYQASYLRMITKKDFEERLAVEKKIVFLEQALSENKSKKTEKKVKKKPLKRKVSKV